MVRMMMLAGAKSPLHHTIQAGHSTAKASAPHFRDVRGLVNEFMVCLQMVGLPGIMDVASLPHRETRHAGTAHSYPNRARERSRAFSASTSRSRGGALVCNAANSRRALSETSETARLNASALACDGELKPDSFRTNCSAEAWISAWVAGGSKLNRVLMLRHMIFSWFRRGRGVSPRTNGQREIRHSHAFWHSICDKLRRLLLRIFDGDCPSWRQRIEMTGLIRSSTFALAVMI